MKLAADSHARSYYTSKEVAAVMDIRLTALYAAVSANRFPIPSYKVCGRRRWVKAVVDEWFEMQKAQGLAKLKGLL